MLDCLAYEPADLQVRFGKAARYVRQLAELEFGKEFQYNTAANAAQEDRDCNDLRQTLHREFPDVAKELKVPAIQARRKGQAKLGPNETLKRLLRLANEKFPHYTHRELLRRVDDMAERQKLDLVPLSWRGAGAVSLVAAYDSTKLRAAVKRFVSGALNA